MIITIDGPAGAGKSTVAKKVADRLGIAHLNTGAMYRAVTIAVCDSDDYESTLADNPISVKFIDNVQHTFVGDTDVNDRLRDNNISILTPKISTTPYIREYVSNITRQLSQSMSLVMDGRDSGSYVLPNADYKIYLYASIYARASRRKQEMISEGEDISLDTLIQQMTERDAYDMAKEVAPLVVPNGAIMIDNSDMDIEQTCMAILKHIKY